MMPMCRRRKFREQEGMFFHPSREVRDLAVNTIYDAT